MNTKSIVAYLDALIKQGEDRKGTEFTTNKELPSYRKTWVELEEFRRWTGNCRVLEHKLGPAFAVWSKAFTVDMNNESIWVPNLLGNLRSIKDAVEGGHLEAFKEIVIAEAFSNLLEQADYPFRNGYHLAAGVLGRAVLEEELRFLAQNKDCLPQKSRPTLNDLNTELYKAGIYDKLEFKLIESLTAIGNECAHNLPGATPDRVQLLLEQLVMLLARLKP